MNLKDNKNIPDVPFSVKQVQKNINYFNSCGYHEYAEALNKYLKDLTQYKRGRYQRPPKYPSVCQFQPIISSVKPKSYKRPLMYQGVHI